MNWSDYGARNYDAALGRWMNIDNYSESFVSETPYQYTLNNPIYFIDPDGNLTQGGHQTPDDNYVFDENGNFVRIDVNDQPDKIVIESSETGEATATYQFNDPENDTKDILSGVISKVSFISDKQITDEMHNNGSQEVAADDEKSNFEYLERESRPPGDESVFSGTSSGKLDHYSTSSLVRNSGGLALVETNGMAYNPKDFGNFLWGKSVRTLGFEYGTAVIGSQGNNLLNSRTDSPSSEYSPIDSAGDQRAIKAGYFYPNKGPKKLDINNPVTNPGAFKPWEPKF